MKFFATVAPGLEEILSAELKGLGARNPEITKGGVSFTGTLENAYRVCLFSRLANRVLLAIQEFPAATSEELYAGVRNIWWGDHLTPEKTLAVDFTSTRSKISHTQFGALKTKDAIVDQFRDETGIRPSVDPERPDVKINVHVEQDSAVVSIDLSGESLHRRGYRLEGAQAPLKETLAAGILALAGWPEKACADGMFVDPMCGSGTLPIEAALTALDVAPGLLRKTFGFLRWNGHDPALWKRLLSEGQARAEAGKGKKIRVLGSDIDSTVIKLAQENAKRAGVVSQIRFERRDFPEKEVAGPIGGTGLVLLNPPYGERMGETEQLKPLYSQIGDAFKNRYAGWTGAIFSGNPDLAKCVGLRASRRIPLFNGPIECRLLLFDLYEGSRKIKALPPIESP